jgi:hypothetical protein
MMPRKRERTRTHRGDWTHMPMSTANLPKNAFGDNADTQDEDVGTYYHKATFVGAGYGYEIYDEGHDKT